MSTFFPFFGSAPLRGETRGGVLTETAEEAPLVAVMVGILSGWNGVMDENLVPLRRARHSLGRPSNHFGGAESLDKGN
jgi:hypothetical protein